MTLNPDYTKLIGMIWTDLVSVDKPIQQVITDALDYFVKKYQDDPVLVEINTMWTIPDDFKLYLPIYHTKECLPQHVIIWSKADVSLLQHQR